MSSLTRSQIIQNEISTARHLVHSRVGAGGFAEAYRVSAIDENDDPIGADTCLKVTTDDTSWHGESYFGSLLRDDPHVVKMLDSFPIIVGEGRAARIRFCIEMELVEGGTVRDAVIDGRLPWPEDRVARQIRLLLRPLALLHQAGTSHRDITPGNVFVGNRSALKLGDFGIVKTAVKRSGVIADAYTAAFRPPLLGTWWSASDDVYQVGLLALTLLSGEEITNDVKKPFVNQVTTRGWWLRDVIKTAISVKSQRYQNAQDMLEAMTG